ncbi:hypothetical protein LEMLEM_LOCUS7755, partial [Lemmus lemmus]
PRLLPDSPLPRPHSSSTGRDRTPWCPASRQVRGAFPTQNGGAGVYPFAGWGVAPRPWEMLSGTPNAGCEGGLHWLQRVCKGQRTIWGVGAHSPSCLRWGSVRFSPGPHLWRFSVLSQEHWNMLCD